GGGGAAPRRGRAPGPAPRAHRAAGGADRAQHLGAAAGGRGLGGGGRQGARRGRGRKKTRGKEGSGLAGPPVCRAPRPTRPRRARRAAEDWPATRLPPHIRQLTHFGERADFSPDGKRIVFIARSYGDVYEYELATGIIRPVTHHYPHAGYTRALYLPNGDIILS